MKNLIAVLMVFVSLNIYSQSLTVEVSRDSILQDNQYTISFVASNIQGSFQPPELSAFNVLGSTTQSMTSIVNGEKSSTQTYKYQVYADQVGVYTVPPAFFEAGGVTYNSEPLDITVYPNPDGIIQEDKSDNNYFFFSDPKERYAPFFDRQKKDKKEKSDKPVRQIKRI